MRRVGYVHRKIHFLDVRGKGGIQVRGQVLLTGRLLPGETTAYYSEARSMGPLHLYEPSGLVT